MRKLFGYAVASFGPIATAGAQFLLSVLILRALPAATFGGFSFLLVVATLATSVWSALFCAPLLVFMTRGESESAAAGTAAVLATSAMASVASAALFFLLALLTGLSMTAAIGFALFASLGLVRWLGRSHAYARGKQLRTMGSDISYAIALIIGIAVLVLSHGIAQDSAYLILLIATIVGIAAFGRAYWGALASSLTLKALATYRNVWREHSSWSLAGVVSTEATVNCHAYLVTAMCGPAAFAPIAATQLLIRPITIATNALMEFERAQMARHLGRGEVDAAAHSVHLFRFALAAICVLMAGATAALFLFAPRLLFPQHYALPTLMIGAASWLCVASVRAIRTPESALLQAAGAFRPLAHASIYSAAFSIVTVVVVLLTAAPIWSVAGVLGGELVFLYWVWRQATQWTKVARAGAGSMTLVAEPGL